ncbi:NAD(P)-binding protein [Sistotremastrum suecicum HHB10207 ss-3]|uniref:NAD(P)-binding protein n=1 Tax=Sistotremastrum suecicum HHB10207 ss-3 TaxID=1314776 RepID=A0A166ISG2_9AGAM|nr:NAD(P)-binding protein [Sistotremastrum suecicum HHB10207 ss-3]
MKVLITGASGVLGKAVYNAFSSAGHAQVTGLSFSQSLANLTQLDLQDPKAVGQFFETWKGSQGDWVIHCAAERRPDVAEKLNAEVPGHLAQLSKTYGFTLVYISTDYVFDGTSPPYFPDSKTNPLQLYGRTKLAGEQAVLGVEGAHAIVLRVPVLYGPAPKPSDSAINILLDVVRDQSGKTYQMDHFATRYPTNVLDIGKFLVCLAEGSVHGQVPPIIHFSAPEPFTKYEICLIYAALLGVEHKHIIADSTDPSTKGATNRPRDCKLDTRATEVLLDGIEGGVLGCVGFEEWWSEELKR